MKYRGYNDYILEEDEPAFRSCWECNGAHRHLKDVAFLHYCMWCNRHWIHGRFLESFNDEKEMAEFLKAHLEAG